MHLQDNSLTLRACSICLHVLRSGEWIAAETIIVELRSFEDASPPHLEPALCTSCEESINRRRVQPAERLVAA
jgi:hypothetical protein